MNEKLFVSPEKFPGLTGAAVIQAAVDKAIGEDIRVVRITGQWELERPVRLPSYTTVILDGAVIRSVGVAFENTNAGDPESRSLAGEQKGICILGKHGAVLRCENGPQILLSNVRNAKLQGIAFEGGEGLRLEHVYYSKAQKLSFRDSRYGVYLTEGCCNNLLEDIDAETQRDAICWVGGDSAIWGRNANLYDSILCRLRAKCREGDGDSTVRVSTAAGVMSDKPQYFFLERYMASFIEEMKQFIAAINEDKEVPVGIHAGLMSVVLAKAAKKSLDEHRPVKITEIL